MSENKPRKVTITSPSGFSYRVNEDFTQEMEIIPPFVMHAGDTMGVIPAEDIERLADWKKQHENH